MLRDSCGTVIEYGEIFFPGLLRPASLLRPSDAGSGTVPARHSCLVCSADSGSLQAGEQLGGVQGTAFLPPWTKDSPLGTLRRWCSGVML